MTVTNTQSDNHMSRMAITASHELKEAITLQCLNNRYRSLTDIVKEVLYCAHCKLPLKGNFVCGDNMDGNTFNVFFHGDKKECQDASGRIFASQGE